jgi:propanol-preferring alcohol dehydrogenase
MWAMRAMVLTRRGAGMLEAVERPRPPIGASDVLVRVHACGVCRTDLHLVDDELPNVRVPVVPGHEIIGTIEQLGPEVAGLRRGQRVGVPWLGYSCGRCVFCTSGRENLCERAEFTGYQRDGGYAEQMRADARYVFPIPERYADVDAAPLMCAGLIGHRAYRMAGDATRLGLYGFGAAAHIVAQVAVAEGRDVYAFTSPGDSAAQQLARELGVLWAGSSTEAPPATLDAAIIFAPVGALVPEALSHVARGGTVVCAGIHMSDIPSFRYELLWGERVVRSVANLTRRDAQEFLAIASRIPLRMRTTAYALADANRALSDLRSGRVTGAAVLVADTPGERRR